MERDGFVFYRSFYEGIKDLPRDIQGDVLTAIMEYGLNGVTTENLKPIARAIFTLIKPQLDANNQKFMNGKGGGRPPKEKPNHNLEETKPKPNDNQTITKQEPKEKVKVKEKEKVKEESKRESIPPNPQGELIENLFSEEGIVKSLEQVNTGSEKKEKICAKKESEIVDYFHEKCKNLPRVQVVSDKRKTSIKTRIKEYGEEKVLKVIEMAGESKFLAGDNYKNWTADFDWVFNSSNFIKIMEGNYKNKDTDNGKSNYQTGASGNNPPSQQATYNIQDAAGRLAEDFAKGNIPGVYR
ncbi:DUF6291 domain-containing protein [Chryseobacterium sp. JK1]|uniref:DUF6291 domain-containing protein n=1 Tax=Chryseobacterium sp. JK1 TaxID=874294 RepID=UPI003D680A28